MKDIERGELLLRATDVVKHFPVRSLGLHLRGQRPVVHAVDGVSLEVRRGETLGVVGESGCGKSTLGRCLVRLTDLTSGTVEYAGQDITRLSRRRLRPVRRDVQLVFQDPYASLNPRRRVGDVVAEPMQVHGFGTPAEIRRRVAELFDVVGLSAAHVERYPHEFSGGQRQRIGIARALAMDPKLIVADEPVSALDVSIQAQVLNLFADLQRDLGVAAVFIAHDLGVVEHVSDDVAVMYLGSVVESGPAGEVLSRPQHPYTRALVEAIPHPDPRRRARHQPLPGEIPSPVDPPPGCAFHPRCALVREDCRRERPVLTLVRGGSSVACPVVVQHPPPSPDPAHPIESGRTTCPPQT